MVFGALLRKVPPLSFGKRGDFLTMNLGLDFLEASGFSAKVANERNVLAANLERAEDFDLRDSGRVDRENLFDSDAVDVFADGDGLFERTCPLGSDDESAELLDAGLFTFLDDLVHFDFHAGADLRNVGLDEFGLNFANEGCVRHFLTWVTDGYGKARTRKIPAYYMERRRGVKFISRLRKAFSKRLPDRFHLPLKARFPLRD